MRLYTCYNSLQQAVNRLQAEGEQKIDLGETQNAMTDAKEANWLLLFLVVLLALPSIALHAMKIPESPLTMAVKLSASSLIGIVGFLGLKRLNAPFIAVLSRKNISPSLILTGGALIFLYISLTISEVAITKQVREFLDLPKIASPFEDILPLLRSKNLMIFFLFHVIVWGPFCEELFFRGYLQRAYSRMGMLHSVLWPSLFFAFLHRGGMAPFSKIFMGASLTLISLRYNGSIMPSFLIHMGNNLLPPLLITIAYAQLPRGVAEEMLFSAAANMKEEATISPLLPSMALYTVLFFAFIAILSTLFLRRLWRQCPITPSPQMPLKQGWKIVLHLPIVLLGLAIYYLAY